MLGTFLFAFLALLASSHVVHAVLTPRQQSDVTQVWDPTKGPTLGDIQGFYLTPHNETALSLSIGGALWAMTKCNHAWPQQLFEKVADTADDWRITLYHPRTGKPFEPIAMDFDSIHNINSDTEPVTVSKRWWAAGLYNALETQWDQFKGSADGRDYIGWVEETYRDLKPVQGDNLVESHFVMAALFQRDIIVTQTDDPAKFVDITAKAIGSPMILLRSVGDSEYPSSAVMRKVDPDAQNKFPSVWFGSPWLAPDDNHLVMDSARSYPALTLVHLTDLEARFDEEGSWYHA